MKMNIKEFMEELIDIIIKLNGYGDTLEDEFPHEAETFWNCAQNLEDTYHSLSQYMSGEEK